MRTNFDIYIFIYEYDVVFFVCLWSTTFIMYVQMQKIEKVNNSSLWKQDTKVPTQYIQLIIGSGHLCYEEIVLDINNPKINIRETEGAIKIGKSRDTGNIDEEKQSKNTTQYVFDTIIRKQTHTTVIRHEPSYKQLKVKTNRTSYLCGNNNGHYNTELRT